VGAELVARLRHARRRLVVAVEHHLDLDEVLALHDAHAAGRCRALAQRVGERLGQRVGHVDGLDADHGDADVGRRLRARRPDERAQARDYGQIATHWLALYTKQAMRLSISAKIFVGFLLVLATFGAVATYGGITMRNLGDELRLVTRGYLDLQLQV